MTNPTQNPLTMRSQIAVRFSTAPALVGYAANADQRADAESNFRNTPASFRGTVRAALNYRRSTLNSLGGAFSRWEFVRVATGEIVDLHELEQLESEADFRPW